MMSIPWQSEKTPLFLTLNLQVEQLELNKGYPAQNTHTHLKNTIIGTSECGWIGMSRKVA